MGWTDGAFFEVLERPCICDTAVDAHVVDDRLNACELYNDLLQLIVSGDLVIWMSFYDRLTIVFIVLL